MNIANNGDIIDRGVIISNYTQETIDRCWGALATNVIQNYQKGKGTNIKGFGVFTYKAQEVNLEGTTNQFVRDKKPRSPVFVVSKEFDDQVAAGEYTPQNGIRYFTQRESKDISIVRLNLAEIAYSLSMAKDEVGNLLNNLIKYTAESIRAKTFQSKILPGLGVLMCRGNIVAVKFNDNFSVKNKLKNNKNTFTKKNVLLSNDFEAAQNVMANDCLTPFENVNDLLASKALSTKVTRSGAEFLKNEYGIDAAALPKHEVRDIYNEYGQNKCEFKFLNDQPLTAEQIRNMGLGENAKNQEGENEITLNKLKRVPPGLNGLSDDTLKTIEYFKGELIRNSKRFDLSRSGRISRPEAIEALSVSGIPGLDQAVAKRIVNFYCKTDNVEYMKLVAQMVKDARGIMEKRRTGRKNWEGRTEKGRSKGFNATSTGFRKASSNTIQASSQRAHSLGEEAPRELSKSSKDFFVSRQRETEDCRRKLKTINALLPELFRSHFTALSQKISACEFANILSQHSIDYPLPQLVDLLLFLGIKDTDAFTLREFEEAARGCRILRTKVSVEELNKVMKKLKDVVYMNGGESFMFNSPANPKDTVDRETFVKLFIDKVDYSHELLTDVFDYLVKTSRPFTHADFSSYFPVPPPSREPDLLSMIKRVSALISARHLQVDEFFDFLVGKNASTKDRVLTREKWIKYLQEEKLGFSAEELDNLFKYIDTKKDNIIDREEFCGKFSYSVKPLVQIQDIVNRYKLDVEDLAHRMKIDITKDEDMNFETFKSKIKFLDYTLPDNFILSIFGDLKKPGDVVSSKALLDAFNYVKPPEAYKSFTKSYMGALKEKVSFEELKKIFEYFDVNSMGTLTKLEYVKSVEKYLPQYNDVDHMRFVRVTNMFDSKGYVRYPDLLNLIFFFSSPLSQGDAFTKLLLLLQKELRSHCQGDVELLMYLIVTGSPRRRTTLSLHRPLEFREVERFIEKKGENIQRKIVMKLDVDADGVVSYEDLYAVLKRFDVTSFFKYNNDSKDPNINLFSKETMNDNRFKNIVKSIKQYMKQKNITEIGLFKKFDKDNDGFFSCVDFNSSIDDIVQLAPAIKDQFFNYLDFYHNGMVDLETFVYRLKDYTTHEIMIQNNNSSENLILQSLREYILKNANISDNEIFSVMDKDCDGLVNLADFREFTVRDLGVSEIEFNDRKLERVMMSLSLSKNLQIGLNDIREFINLTNQKKGHMNLKEVFKLTSNQNLSELKKNKDWTNDIIERFGMYVSEKFESIEEFFKENVEKNSDKFKFEDFIRFHEKNYELFNNGFNLTKDELLSIFTSLDSHKKNYLTLTDLKNKLHIFNFYNKMHIDVKNFLVQNFRNGSDAFRFFLRARNNIQRRDPDKEDNEKARSSLTLKEFFEAFQNFFPGKYSTNTVLKYISKYFKIDTSNSSGTGKNSISFSEFNYIYFDSVKSDEEFLKSRSFPTKLMTNRDEISGKMRNELLSGRTQSNLFYANLNKKKFEMLCTPFDVDPLNKIKRVLCSSKYDLNRFFETAANLCGNNSYIVNKFQFKNIIKELDIGLTNLEIEQILMKSGKLTYDGMINLRDFVRFLYSLNPTLVEGARSSSQIVSEIKSLIYKFYSNPVICFQNNDRSHSGRIGFDRFREIVNDMYEREKRTPPNFALVKNCFDKIDLRKDGVVDLNEWGRAFGYYNGKLDVHKGDKNPVSNEQEFYDNMYKDSNNFQNKSISQHNRKVLRDWETSADVSNLYKTINKNRKIIKQNLEGKGYIIDSDGQKLIQANNFIEVLKEIMPNVNLSPTQWKMVVNVAKTETADSLINLYEFFRLMEITSKNMISHPKVKNKKLSNFFFNYSPSFNPLYNTNGVAYKTANDGFYYNRRSNSINREKLRGLSSLEYSNNELKLPYTGKAYQAGINKSSFGKTQREPLAY